MTLIRRSNPFGELMSLRQAMDRLLEDSFVSPRGGGNGTEEQHLALDVYTTSDALVVEAALPGVKPDDVKVSVLGDSLTISGSTHEEQKRDEGGYSYREIRRGAFSRTVTLPSGLKADAATASFENGLLRLSFPKAEEAKPRQIQIKPTTTTEGKATPVSGQQDAVGAGQKSERQGS
jgi:HSP20 family protein